MPWNQRKALVTHHRWFRNIVDFHNLTRSWTEESTNERQAHSIERVTATTTQQDYKILESLPDARLENLLNDTTPEDLLGRLDYSAWAMQAWTYATLSQNLSAIEKAKLDSVLEQASFKQGRAVAEKRWNSAAKRIQGSFSEDLRALFLTLVDTPVACNLGEDAFLLRRGLERELEFELRSCPHHCRYPEVSGVADELCFLQSAWIRGYVYGLNHQVTVQYQRHSETSSNSDLKNSPLTGGRCKQHWKLSNR